ncbi:MAG: serine/threonine-protein kinase [Pirellulaceae bacterium]|nr:serine/threonine-protein kinase [Pirellulaceae bacterium]
MAPPTQTVFRKSAIISGLVTEDQLRLAIAEIRNSMPPESATGPIDDKKLGEKLTEQGVISEYQADQLNAGRTKLNLGPYIITDWIGQGGMGQVFKAVHEMMGRECAVKVLPQSKATAESIANFRREIRMQANLDHHNLVRAYDAGEDGNVNYLVVEYVAGTDLRRLVRSKGKLTVQQASSIIMNAATGIEYAHREQLVHRDVKPGNILVTPDGTVKVSDLGLAGFLEDSTDPRHGKTVGTADYLSPEQIQSPLNISKATDIYSLGCTLYYAVTGKVPYPGGTPKSKARRHLEETPWHPRRFNDEISDEYVDLIADMMEKDPQDRIQSCEEVAQRLAPWATDDNIPVVHSSRQSRWMPEPPPSVENERSVINSHDTGSASYDVADLAISELSGQVSASTGSVGNQDSQRTDMPAPPPPILVEPGEEQSSAAVLIMWSLSIAIPVSMLIGFVLGYLFSRSEL